jgi:Fe-S-cluster containining protein
MGTHLESGKVNTDHKILLLQEVYRIFDDFTAGIQFHCHRGCAWCCTRNVTMTTLEAAAMLRVWNSTGFSLWLDTVRSVMDQPRLQPVTTLNQFAELCSRDAPIPEGGKPVGDLTCPFLDQDMCGIYEMRPFACRAMVSNTSCGISHMAQMPELVLTANNIVMQYIEALDVHGFTGNLIDILLTMSNALQQRAYQTQSPMSSAKGLLINRPVSVLMVPSEHRESIQPLMNALRQAQQKIVGVVE